MNIDSQKELHDELKNHLFEMPPMVVGVAIYKNKFSGRFQIEALFNGLAVHSPPMAISFVSNGLLGTTSCNLHIFSNKRFDIYFFF